MLHQNTGSRMMRLGIFLVVTILIGLPVWSVAADSPTPTTPSGVGATGAPNTPQSVGLNTPVTFSGNGFKPNESLSIWEIGPDGSVTPLSGVQSDANGAFSVTVSFPLAGQWQVTAHSITNGNESVGYYAAGQSGTTIGPTTPTSSTTPTSPATSTTTTTGPILGAAPTFPGSNTVPPAPPSNGTPVALGSPTTFSGSGFTANEQISLWETAPGGGVTALPGIAADGTGAFSTSVTFSTAGQWAVTAHGITSGKETVGTYAVGTTGGTTTTTGTTSTGSASNLTGPSATPATVGTAVTYTASGFTANEPISLWMTGPDSLVTALPSEQADGTGALSASVTFTAPGSWQVTAHGRTSGHESIGRYDVTGTGSTAGTTSTTTGAASPPSSGTTATPVSATSGTPVDFTANGFNANETVTVWTTDPNGIVTPQSSAQADAKGVVTVTISFNAIGLWRVTTHGRDSAHEVVGQFQVS